MSQGGINNNIHSAGATSNTTRGSSDSTRSQARAGRFRSDGGRYLQQVKSRLRAFKRGTSRRNRRVQPLPADQDARSHRQFNQYSPETPNDPGVATALASEQVVVDRLV